MLGFIGIWFNMDREVKRDHVMAIDANDASEKIHSKYAGRKEPAMALTIVPVNGYSQNGSSGYRVDTLSSH